VRAKCNETKFKFHKRLTRLTQYQRQQQPRTHATKPGGTATERTEGKTVEKPEKNTRYKKITSTDFDAIAIIHPPQCV
jgi:hypothetical protein